MPVAIDVGQRVLVYNPSHGWTTAYFVRAQQTKENKLQILVSVGEFRNELSSSSRVPRHVA